MTLLRITNVLDNELLSPELRARKLPERLEILALMSGAQKNGLDNISTIESLRNILIPLGGDSRYAYAVEPLTSIFLALLPIAAA